MSVPRSVRRVSARRTRAAVRSGLDHLLARTSLVRGLRLGLIANPTAVTADLVHAAPALHFSFALGLLALFCAA